MIEILKKFIPYAQQDVLKDKEILGATRLPDLAESINKMPKTYEAENIKVKDKVAHLHYFVGGFDWYIIEKDMLPEQRQAFGVVKNGDTVEFGYIDITELQSISLVEFDFYWEPKPLSEISSLSHFISRFKSYDDEECA